MLAVFICTTSNIVNAEKYLASLIIDDVGDNYDYINKIVSGSAEITLAILPQTPYAKKIASVAQKHGKEIMLHLPMQSVAHHKHSPGTLSLHMTKNAFLTQLQINIDAIPNIKGVNNHMGSLMTQHPGYMNLLMQSLAKHPDLYFVDSRTTDKSIASKIAQENNVPTLQRDVFLDPDFDKHTIEQQFERFIRIAKTQGYALAIAHPHPVSMAFIFDNIHKLQQHGIKLVPVSKLIQQRSKQHHVTCTGTTCTGL